MTTPNSSTPVQRYHPALMALHWLMALMIIALLLGGSLVTAPTPNTDPEKIGHIKGHMIVALSVGVLLIVRLLVRLRTSHPAPARSGPGPTGWHRGPTGPFMFWCSPCWSVA